MEQNDAIEGPGSEPCWWHKSGCKDIIYCLNREKVIFPIFLSELDNVEPCFVVYILMILIEHI